LKPLSMSRIAILTMLVLCLCWSLPVWAEDGDLENELDSSESESAEDLEDGEAIESECLKDSDCGPGKICRDNGTCVTQYCDKDLDCENEDFFCREDGKCAPLVCLYDKDCLSGEFCDHGKCLTSPGESEYPYVEGGVSNCNQADCDSSLLMLLALMGLLMALRRRTV